MMMCTGINCASILSALMPTALPLYIFYIYTIYIMHAIVNFIIIATSFKSATVCLVTPHRATVEQYGLWDQVRIDHGL